MNHFRTTTAFWLNSFLQMAYESIKCPFIPRCEPNTEHYLQQFTFLRVHPLLCKLVLILYMSLIFLSNTTIYQLTHPHFTVHNWVYWSHNVATCFGSWSHHQVIYWQTLYCWIAHSIWIHILFLLLCVTITWRNIVCFSHFRLITFICIHCILYCFKNVLNKYLNLLKVSKH
jgi:hypothetical protein